MTLAAARAALDAGAWRMALEALEPLEPVPPEALEIRATALYAVGDLDGSIAAWEQLHARRAAVGDGSGAARAAVMVSMFLLIDSGLMAPTRGWLGRARSLLDGLDEGPVHALLATVNAYERFFCGDTESTRELASLAVSLGERHDVPSAIAIARTLQARLQLLEGDLDNGLQALDEVGAYLMTGDADPLTVGMMLCEIVCTAQSLAMPELAREWTHVMDRWRSGPGMEKAPIGGINGRCRVHRAELLRLSGPAELAEAEALAACDALRPWMQREFGWPLVELGNIRLRRGDLDGAEDAYLAADALAWSPQPGLALLRLAQGDTAAATELIADAVANPPDLPWKERPPIEDLRHVDFLAAQAEIAFAARDAGLCTTAAERLSCIAGRYPSRGLAATASLARARAAVLARDPDLARTLAHDAAAIWIDLRAPYEAAVARTVAAQAADAAGAPAAAALERRAARSAFESFGAHRCAARLAARADVRPSPSELRNARFQIVDGVRQVSCGETELALPDLVGFRHIAHLLAQPGRDIAAIDLVVAERGSVSRGPAPQLGLPTLDDQARAAYRRRLQEVDDDIAEAEANNDPRRADLARRDRDFLVAELSRAVGWDGRTREVGGDAERARTAVFRSIRYAIDRIGDLDPDLAQHLRRAVSTGTWCRYDPDPLAPVTWEVN